MVGRLNYHSSPPWDLDAGFIFSQHLRHDHESSEGRHKREESRYRTDELVRQEDEWAQ